MWVVQFIFVVLLTVNVLCEEEQKESAIQLTSVNFDDALKQNNHFIMFFAPWCGHCKNFLPVWEKLAETMNGKEDPKVLIAKVDCTQYQDICSAQAITGYPTLRFFKLGSIESEKFEGARDLSAINAFIQRQLGESSANDENITVLEESSDKLIELTDETFNSFVSSGKHFIKFYAPWCSHCQKLLPTWQNLAEKLKNDKNVKISKIDCTQYRPTCQNFEVKGYPTLLWFNDGKKLEKYTGPRNIDSLLEYVHKNIKLPSKESKDEDEPISTVRELNKENFEKEISEGVVFVKFYAPWCGHCKKLNPVWEDLGNKLRGNSNVKISKIDCTTDGNKKLCLDEQVEGYPTLFIYKNGRKIVEYYGVRQLHELHSFVLKYIDRDEL